MSEEIIGLALILQAPLPDDISGPGICGFTQISARALTPRALSDNEFTLALSAQGYPQLSLNAVPGPSNNTLSVIFEDQAAYPGTPCYMNATYLNFDVGGSIPFALSVSQLGEVHGKSVALVAIQGQENGRAGLSLEGGQLAPPLDNAAEDFFACNGTVNGGDALVLKFGVFNSDGSAPVGCVAATLVESGGGDSCDT